MIVKKNGAHKQTTDIGVSLLSNNFCGHILPEQTQTKKDWFYFYHEDHEGKEELNI